jgi:hypothetical protein
MPYNKEINFHQEMAPEHKSQVKLQRFGSPFSLSGNKISLKLS